MPDVYDEDESEADLLALVPPNLVLKRVVQDDPLPLLPASATQPRPVIGVTAGPSGKSIKKLHTISCS